MRITKKSSSAVMWEFIDPLRNQMKAAEATGTITTTNYVIIFLKSFSVLLHSENEDIIICVYVSVLCIFLILTFISYPQLLFKRIGSFSCYLSEKSYICQELM